VEQVAQVWCPLGQSVLPCPRLEQELDFEQHHAHQALCHSVASLMLDLDEHCLDVGQAAQVRGM
jgi:hypothetical protein